MTNSELVFVGMKIWRNSIDIAFAPNGHGEEDRFYKTISASNSSFVRVVDELKKRFKNPYFVYEAGAYGYDYFHYVSGQGLNCDVVAPPPKTRKTRPPGGYSERDALELARLQRAGELTPVYVPGAIDETIHDLLKCCETARLTRRQARRRVREYLKRNDIHCAGELTWSYDQLNWLQGLTFKSPEQTITFKEYLDMAATAGQRLKRLEQHINQAVMNWSMRSMVNAYQALRGVNFFTAVTLSAELGDLRCFDNPRKLQNYVGLNQPVKGVDRRSFEQISGRNSLLMSVLYEAAWAYSEPAGTTSMVTRLLTGLPKPVAEMAKNAELRLCQRYRSLLNDGYLHEQALTKIARDLLHYIWSIAQEVSAQ